MLAVLIDRDPIVVRLQKVVNTLYAFTTNGDQISDTDGDGSVELDGVTLSGATANEDNDFIGGHSEIYEASEEGLTATLGVSSIEILGWENEREGEEVVGQLGIAL